jgi:hypothetical protein
MNDSNHFDLTSGEGSVLVEIVSKALPITPEVLQRPRIRPDRFAPPTNRQSPVDEHRNDSHPTE